MKMKSFLLLIYFILSLFFMEIILKLQTGGALFSIGTFISFLFLSVFAIIFYMISRLFSSKINHILSVVFLSLTAILYLSQLIYFKFFKTFYTLYSAGNAGQVLEFWKDIVGVVTKNIFWIILILIPPIVLAVWGKRFLSYKKMKNLTVLSNVSLAAVLYLSAIGIIHISGKQLNSPYDLYYNSSSPVISVNQLGLLTTMRLDLQRQLTGWQPVLASPIPFYPDDNDNEKPDDKDPNQNPEDNPTDPAEEIVYEDQVLDIDFESLIAKEKNKDIKEMHQYFASVPPTKKNAYTGKFKDYNFIFITAEGFSPYAVNKDVTPTLYKMVHEGFNFTNFYNPIWGVSTSDGEYVALTGLIPKSGVWSFYQSSDNWLPFVMGNQFKKLGYKTVAYHNHTWDYYRRDVSHPNMGYDYKGVGHGLDIKVTWPESDLEMAEVTVPEYINDTPFHAYYMTVSGHMQYTFTGNYISYKNKSLVQHLDLSEQAKAYLACQIELDRMLEHLLKKLEEAGIAEKTLIALSADHYPYGLEKATIDEFAGHTVEENFELYKSTFIVYAKGMEPEVIDKPASSLDIIPTLSNLLGLEYDSRLLMGQDIFSDSDPLVIFSNRSFITDKGRYNAVTHEFTPAEGVTVNEEYINRMQAIVNSKFYFSTKILDNDYYSLVVDRYFNN